MMNTSIKQTNAQECKSYIHIALVLILFSAQTMMAENLEQEFANPPNKAKASCYWWWLNNLVDKECITRDLEQFKAKGIADVLLICSVNGFGAGSMPSGPAYLSSEWIELYRHALKEAERLQLVVGVNFCAGGWCMGGPWITPEYGCRWFLQSQVAVTGPKKFSAQLPLPGPNDGYESRPELNVSRHLRVPLDKADCRDSAVVAFREPEGGVSKIEGDRKKSLAGKSNRLDANCFAAAKAVMKPSLVKWTSQPGDAPIAVDGVIDLTGKMKPDGHLDWDVPPGTWTIVRTGHRMTGAKTSLGFPQSTGLEVDWFSPAATDLHFDHLGKQLIQEAGGLAGKTLAYFHTDSFEDGYPNWTADLLTRFKSYRGYDPRPYLPVFLGRIVGSAEISDRFLNDYRKTVADCMADGNYGRLAERSREYGIELQAEAAGPSWSGTICLDALKNLGRCARPMGEFWQDGNFVAGHQNQVIKQTASAAHIYGRRTASAEAFTSFVHWQEAPAALKPIGDRAFCEGINRFVLCLATCQRSQDGKPGYDFGSGTHFNPNVTWWDMAAAPWLAYVNRCQALLQSGLFVADVLYYNGDWAPNLVEQKHVDPALGAGYDYDVCNAEVLLTRLSVKDGRLVLPDGMSYRLLVLPETTRMPVDVLVKLKELVEAGATIVGPRPESDPGLRDYPKCDETVRNLAGQLWGDLDGKTKTEKPCGRGRVVWGQSLREILRRDGVAPDFEFSGKGAFIDFIHRSSGGDEIYYLANRKSAAAAVEARFRIARRQPELWDPVTGERHPLPEFTEANGTTRVPLQFEPDGSLFVVFRGNSQKSVVSSQNGKKNFPDTKPVMELTGAWDVQFDPQWFYPDNGTGGKVKFEKLEDWSLRPEPAIQYFSGTAVYRKTFDLAGPLAGKIWLDLGTVKETARVRLNSKDLGVVWCAPWRVEMTGAVKEKGNELEIEVVNLWPNRLIGDGKLPQDQRRTRTCVQTYYKPPKKGEHKLFSSGLLGPVRVLTAE